MQPKLIVTFDHLSEADFLAKARFIIVSLTSNTSYPEPWMLPVPSLTQLYEALNVYRDAYHASLTQQDAATIAQRNASRQALTELFKWLAPYLEWRAQGDLNTLSSTGYDLRCDIENAIDDEPLPAFADFRIAYGRESGKLDIRAAKNSCAKSQKPQMTQDYPVVENNWRQPSISQAIFLSL